jgi:hypothetical protein
MESVEEIDLPERSLQEAGRNRMINPSHGLSLRVFVLCLAALGIILALPPGDARTQPPFGGPFGGGNSVMLLGQESVQKEFEKLREKLP